MPSDADADRPSWVIFDLFGTLVPQFPRVEHDQTLNECGRIVGLDPEQCRSSWGRLYDMRVRGEIPGIAGHLRVVAQERGVTLDAGSLAEATDHYRRFARALVTPLPTTLEVLTLLQDTGIALAVLSNAHHDVAEAFDESPLRAHFAHAGFSCRIGHRKPDPRAFNALLEAVGRPAPNSVTFVGDGSDDELSAAAAVGLDVVLVRSDSSNAYDPDRPEVAAWSGSAIDTLADLPRFLGRRGTGR